MNDMLDANREIGSFQCPAQVKDDKWTERIKFLEDRATEFQAANTRLVLENRELKQRRG